MSAQAFCRRRRAAPRVFELHAYVDGPIVTMIVNNETAISAYVYPQRNESIGVAAWASDTVDAASVDAWELAAAEVRALCGGPRPTC